MPGIVTVFRKNEEAESALVLAQRINNCLVFSDSFSRKSALSDSFALIITGHHNSIIKVIETDELVLGFLGEDTSRNHLFVAELSDLADSEPILTIKKMPMCSSLVIFLKKRKLLYHAVDATATKPVYCTETLDYVITTPEIFTLAVLNKCSWSPKIDRVSVAMAVFSGNGSIISNRTLLSNVKKLGGEANMVPAALMNPLSNIAYLKVYDQLWFGDETWGWFGQGKSLEDAMEACLYPQLERSDITKCIELDPAAKEYAKTTIEEEYRRAAEKYCNSGSWDKTRDLLYWKYRLSRMISNYRYQHATISSTVPPLILENTVKVLHSVPDDFRSNRKLAFELCKRIQPIEIRDMPFALETADSEYIQMIKDAKLNSVVRNSLINNLSPEISWFFDRQSLDTFVRSMLSLGEPSLSKTLKTMGMRGLRAAYRPVRKVPFAHQFFRGLYHTVRPTRISTPVVSSYRKAIILTRLFSLNETLIRYREKFVM